MIQRKPGRQGQGLEVLWTTGTMTGLNDAQLLQRFAQARDSTGELAFRELIHRHGPMVLAVCHQILRHSHDVDDAFQATFLVLIRRAHTVRINESLGPWLCSVAYRTAQRARALASEVSLEGTGTTAGTRSTARAIGSVPTQYPSTTLRRTEPAS